MMSHGISLFSLVNWAHSMICNNWQKAQEFWSEHYYLQLPAPPPAWTAPALSPLAPISFISMSSWPPAA